MPGKKIIVSNRLPVMYDPESKKMIASSGGLVSALANIQSDSKILWAGADVSNTGKEKFDKGLLPIPIEANLYHKYYNGLSNDTIWPLFHYESQFVRFRWDDWEAYKKVNRIFATHILKIANADDLIWIHDFHLFLLPKYLKEKKRKLKIGFFLHIPFPSSEVFRQLPIRKEILEGVIESDLIGFHDYTYLSHFCRAIHLILGLDSSLLLS